VDDSAATFQFRRRKGSGANLICDRAGLGASIAKKYCLKQDPNRLLLQLKRSWILLDMQTEDLF
jgi:hypothetical protein